MALRGGRDPLALDWSGHGRDGQYRGSLTLEEPGAIPCDNSRSVRLSGGTINAGDVLDFPGTQPFSVEAWVRPARRVGGGILGKNCFHSCGRNWRGYWLSFHDSSRFLLRWHRAGTRDGSSANADAPSIGSWHHIVATFDGVNRVIYVNGEEVGSRTSNEPLPDLSTPFVIGDAEGWGNFDGHIDEVAVYDRVLPRSVVRTHHRAGRCN